MEHLGNTSPVVYALCEPDTKKIRYVGASFDPTLRLTGHVGRNASLGVKRWVKELRIRSLAPLITILEECSVGNWREREQYWILHFREQGAADLNRTNGGDGKSGRDPKTLKTTKITITDEAHRRLKIAAANGAFTLTGLLDALTGMSHRDCQKSAIFQVEQAGEKRDAALGYRRAE